MCRLRPNIVSVLEECRHRVSCVRLPRRTRLIFDTVLLHSRVPTAAREVLAGCVSGMCLLSMICKSGLWCSSSPLVLANPEPVGQRQARRVMVPFVVAVIAAPLLAWRGYAPETCHRALAGRMLKKSVGQ